MKTIDIGMVGGGLKSFMGDIHRRAMKKAGNVHLACGVFGESRATSFECRNPYSLGYADVFGSYRELLRREAHLEKDKRIAFIANVVPNAMHYPVAMTAMDNGMPILGETPFTCNLDEATNLTRKQHLTKVPYRIAMVYPAYSLLVKARKLLRTGAIGRLRRFNFSYQLGWMAPRVENNGNKQALWRTDSRRCGFGGVITDSAHNCQFVLEWLTGLEITSVCCAARICVPGRLLPDDATVLVRTANGIGGTFQLSQVATGHGEGLSFEITGDQASMLWRQDEPGRLVLVGVDGKEKIVKDATASGKCARTASLEPFGDNEAYVEALGRVYREFAEFLQGVKRKRVREDDDRILGMTIEEGLRSVLVTDAIMRSSGIPMTPDKAPAPGTVPAVPVDPPKWIAVPPMPKV